MITKSKGLNFLSQSDYILVEIIRLREKKWILAMHFVTRVYGLNIRINENFAMLRRSRNPDLSGHFVTKMKGKPLINNKGDSKFDYFWKIMDPEINSG